MNDEEVRRRLDVTLFRGGASDYDVALDLLLPVVRDIAAEELRQAADAAHAEYSGWEAADVVRARAAALTKPPDGPVR